MKPDRDASPCGSATITISKQIGAYPYGLRKHAQVVDSEVEFPPTCNSSPPRICAASLPTPTPPSAASPVIRSMNWSATTTTWFCHPDMPKAAFADLWDRLKEGNLAGVVKTVARMAAITGSTPTSPHLRARQDKRLPVGALQARPPAPAGCRPGLSDPCWPEQRGTPARPRCAVSGR